MTLIPIALALAMLYAFYIWTVRPVLIDLMRFRLFKIRDDLRRCAIDGEVSSSSFEFMHLEKMLGALAVTCKTIDLFGFTQCAIAHQQPQSPEHAKFVQGAPPRLKQMEKEALKIVNRVMLINSPATSIILLFALSLVLLFNKAFTRLRDILKAWRYLKLVYRSECACRCLGKEPSSDVADVPDLFHRRRVNTRRSHVENALKNSILENTRTFIETDVLRSCPA